MVTLLFVFEGYGQEPPHVGEYIYMYKYTDQ